MYIHTDKVLLVFTVLHQWNTWNCARMCVDRRRPCSPPVRRGEISHSCLPRSVTTAVTLETIWKPATARYDNTHGHSIPSGSPSIFSKSFTYRRYDIRLVTYIASFSIIPRKTGAPIVRYIIREICCLHNWIGMGIANEQASVLWDIIIEVTNKQAGIL